MLGLFLGAVPGMATRYDKRTFADPTQNQLLVLRAMFLRFAIYTVVLGAVIPLLLPGEGSAGEGSDSGALLAAVGLVAVGLASAAAAEWMGRRPLDCSDDQHLAAGYRT